MKEFSLQEYHDADDGGKKAILFQSLMNLLTQAIADDDDIQMIKGYARLATEVWNNYDNEETE